MLIFFLLISILCSNVCSLGKSKSHNNNEKITWFCEQLKEIDSDWERWTESNWQMRLGIGVHDTEIMWMRKGITVCDIESLWMRRIVRFCEICEWKKESLFVKFLNDECDLWFAVYGILWTSNETRVVILIFCEWWMELGFVILKLCEWRRESEVVITRFFEWRRGTKVHDTRNLWMKKGSRVCDIRILWMGKGNRDRDIVIDERNKGLCCEFVMAIWGL